MTGVLQGRLLRMNLILLRMESLVDARGWGWRSVGAGVNRGWSAGRSWGAGGAGEEPAGGGGDLLGCLLDVVWGGPAAERES